MSAFNAPTPPPHPPLIPRTLRYVDANFVVAEQDAPLVLSLYASRPEHLVAAATRARHSCAAVCLDVDWDDPKGAAGAHRSSGAC